MPYVIHRLEPSQRKALARHFAALEPEAVHLRFGRVMNSAARRHYVDSIDFGRDTVFGVSDGGDRLVGVAHLAFAAETAEVGLSVLRKWRAHGLGRALLERAILEARVRRLSGIVLLCAPQNRAMVRLAHAAGLTLESAHGMTEARAPLQPPTAWTWCEAGLADALGYLDKTVRAEQRALDHLTRLCTPALESRGDSMRARHTSTVASPSTANARMAPSRPDADAPAYS